MARQKHFIAVETDSDEVNVTVGGGGKQWWFRVFHSWVDSGWLAVISHPAGKVALVIAKYANAAEGGKAWPSVERIAAHVGIELSTCYKCLAELENAGFIKRTVRPYGAKRGPAWCVMSPAKPPSKAHVEQARLSRRRDFVSGNKLSEGRNSPTLSPGGESRLHSRVRSHSELDESRSSSAARRENEEQAASPLDGMSRAALQQLKDVVVQTADPDLRRMLAKSDPEKHLMLRALMTNMLTAES